MKRFAFYVVNDENKILFQSNGYFDVLRHLSFGFTLDDVNNLPLFTKAKLKRMASMKTTTILRLSKLSSWSSRSGGAEYLVVKCVDDIFDKVDSLNKRLQLVQERIQIINSEVYKRAKDLIDEKKTLEKEIKTLKDELSLLPN